MVTGKPCVETGLTGRTRVRDTWWSGTGLARSVALGLAVFAGARSRWETSSMTCVVGRRLVQDGDGLKGWDPVVSTIKGELRSQAGVVVRGAESTEV